MKMGKDELASILEQHSLWLQDITKGKKADLWGANLRDVKLQGADLRRANLFGADLWGASLRDVKLQGADLRRADLRDVNLQGANLQGAN